MKWVEVQSKLQQAQSMEAVARKNLTDCQLYAPFPESLREESGGRAERGTRCSGAETGIRRPAEGTDFRAGDGNRARGKRQKAVIEAPVLNGTKAEGVVTEKVYRPIRCHGRMR